MGTEGFRSLAETLGMRPKRQDSDAPLPEPKEPAPTAEALEARIRRRRRSAGLEGLERFTFENWDGSPHRMKLYACGPEGWVYITGQHGSGKTHLAVATAHEYLLDQSDKGYGCVYTAAADLLDRLRTTFDRDNESQEMVWRPYAQTPLLVLDSLDRVRTTGWAVEKMGQLLDTRANQMRATVVVSAAREGDVRRQFPALAARVEDAKLCRVVNLGWQ